MDPMFDDLLDLFPDTVVVQPGVRNSFGTFIASGAVMNLKAKVKGNTKLVLGMGGKDVVSTMQAVFPGAFGLTAKNHTYLLPERFTPRNPNPISVDQATDEYGASHERVYF